MAVTLTSGMLWSRNTFWKIQIGEIGPDQDFNVERATGIEPAFSAWEAERRGFRDVLESAKVLVRGYMGCPPVTAGTAP